MEKVLKPVPEMVDEVIRRCHMSSAAIPMVSLELELKGWLERHLGNLF